MNKTIEVEKFIKDRKSFLVIDVRSPGEYHHAHVPAAINIPLFNNEERVKVGTTYKQESRQLAIKIGLDYFGPKMRAIVEEVEKLLLQEPTLKVLVHCWRGGMRSGAVSWLLSIYGFEVYQLIGGYKAYRNWVLEEFHQDYKFRLLGGYTGAGKTKVLEEIKTQGHQLLNLEKLACHKGSAFGHIEMPKQPSQEMFENILAGELIKFNIHEPILVEDESMRIGLVAIPKSMFEKMLSSPMYFFNVPFDVRLKNIVHEYGGLDRSELIDAIRRIEKRLGGLNMKKCIEYINTDNVILAFDILLKYYDRYYDMNLVKHKNVKTNINNIEDLIVILNQSR
jgi:tRNA 2-selenouridine synthase